MALDRLDIGMVSVEVAAGDGKLIKLSLIYPSPGGRPTHGISRSSIFVVTLRPRSPSPSTLSLAIYPSHFSCFYLSRSNSGAPRMRDLKQLKRSAKHFNLASGAFMPRARARSCTPCDIHLSVSSFFDLSYPSAVFLVLSA